jgi:hypothetical protein
MAGLLEANPRQSDGPYGDDWYSKGRYGVWVGRYWTDHLKTEVEFATSGEGSRYVQRYSSAPGVPPYYPYSVREQFRLHQVSGRMVRQFFENSWAHPYVFGGVSYEAERKRVRIPEQYFYLNGDSRIPANRILLSPAVNAGPDTTHRIAAIAGAGTKVYWSPRAFFNTNFMVSVARPSRNISLIAGFGWDF